MRTAMTTGRGTVHEPIGPKTKSAVVSFERRAREVEKEADETRDPVRNFMLRTVALGFRRKALLMRGVGGEQIARANIALRLTKSLDVKPVQAPHILL